MHQAEQPEGPQRDGLATGVRPGHDERGEAVAEADVDRHDTPAQTGMAGRQQDDLGSIGGLRPRPVHVGRQRRLGGPQVEPGERLERLAQGRRVGGHERRQLVEDARDLLGLGDLRLAPGVAELDRDERLDEQGLAAARRVVDDALDPRPRLGLDRHHVAPVAERDDRLLERAAELGADERVEPPPQPVVGDPDGGPQATEPGRGRVEQLARPDRSCGPGSSAGPAGRGARARGRAAAAGARRRASVASRAVASSVSAISRNWAGSSRPPRAARSIAGPMSRAAPIPMPGRSSMSARAWSVSSSAAGDDDRVIGRLERLGQPARRSERGGRREPCPDGRELEQRERALVHGLPAGQRVRVGPDSDRWPRSTKRHGSAAHGSPA